MVDIKKNKMEKKQNQDLRIKFLTGWLKPNSMNEKEWLIIWKDAATKAEFNNMELTVFCIPKYKSGVSNYDVLQHIEKYLQDEFSKP